MEFKTTLPQFKGSFEINHDSKIMLIGSCFSNETGQNLNDAGFQTLINPFGILYNPVSIANCLYHIVSNTKFEEKDFFKYNGLWHSYKLHGSFSTSELHESLSKINSSIDHANDFIQKTNTLIITLGSSWVYQTKNENKIVANCHKMTQSNFTKRKLGVNEVVADLTQLFEHLKNINPQLKIIITISPVKHLNDGIIENNWSKATLIVAVHELVRRFEHIEYFPAFELVNDDLRDYRFYKADMTHPNEIATKYVYNHFIHAYCNAKTLEIANEFTNFSKSVQHKILHQHSDEYIAFKKNIEERATKLRLINASKIETLLSKV